MHSTVMDTKLDAPFACHVFVCTNDRQGVRKSCADGDCVKVRAILKKAVNDRGWKGKVRVSQSGCLGLCACGPNVLLYPQGIHFSNVTALDCDNIMEAIAHIIDALKDVQSEPSSTCVAL